VGVAAGYAVVAAVLEPTNAWLAARALGTSLTHVVRGLAGVAQAALAMAVTVALGRELALTLELPAWVRLLGAVLLGIAVYVPLVAWRAPAARSDLVGLLRSRRGAAAAPQL
jgi:type VI protein secretion system component VasF